MIRLRVQFFTANSCVDHLTKYPDPEYLCRRLSVELELLAAHKILAPPNFILNSTLISQKEITEPNLSLMCLLMGTSNSNGKDEMWYLPRRRTDLDSKTHFPTINVSPPTPTWVNTNTCHRLREEIVTQLKRRRFKSLCQRKSYKRFRYDVPN